MGIKFSYINWVDAPTTVIQADSETTDLTASSVSSPLTYEVWRTVADDGVGGISFDFGQNREIQAIMIQFPRSNSPSNFDDPTSYGSADKIRIRLSTVSDGGTDILDTGEIDSGCLPGFGTFAKWLTSPLSARFLRIDFVATSQIPAGFFDVVRIWAGPVISLSVGVSYGINTLWQSDSIISKASRGTTKFASPQESLRVWSFNLDFIKDPTEKTKMEDFERRMTIAGEFIIRREDEPEGRGDMFCYLSQTTGLTASRFQLSSKTMRVEENI